MRQKSGSIIVPIIIVGAVLLLLGGKRGTGLLNVNHSLLLRNPPQGISTVVTSPRGRQWNVDRRIHWPQPSPGLQPQYQPQYQPQRIRPLYHPPVYRPTSYRPSQPNILDDRNDWPFPT